MKNLFRLYLCLGLSALGFQLDGAAAPSSTAHFGSWEKFIKNATFPRVYGSSVPQYLQNHLLPTVTRLASVCSYAIDPATKLIDIKDDAVTGYDNGLIFAIQNNTGDKLIINQISSGDSTATPATTPTSNQIGSLVQGNNNYYLNTASLMSPSTTSTPVAAPALGNMIEIKDAVANSSVFIQVVTPDQLTVIVGNLNAAYVSGVLAYNEINTYSASNYAQYVLVTNFNTSVAITGTDYSMYRMQAINVAEFNGNPYFVTLQINKENFLYGLANPAIDPAISKATLILGDPAKSILYPSIVSVKTFTWQSVLGKKNSIDVYMPLLLVPNEVLAADISGLTAQNTSWNNSFIAAMTGSNGDTAQFFKSTLSLYDAGNKQQPPARVVIDAANQLQSGQSLVLKRDKINNQAEASYLALMGSDVWDFGSNYHQDIPILNLYTDSSGNIVPNQTGGTYINFGVTFGAGKVVASGSGGVVASDEYGVPYNNMMLFSLPTATMQAGVIAALSQPTLGNYQLIFTDQANNVLAVQKVFVDTVTSITIDFLHADGDTAWVSPVALPANVVSVGAAKTQNFILLASTGDNNSLTTWPLDGTNDTAAVTKAVEAAENAAVPLIPSGPIPAASTLTQGFSITPGQTLSYFAYNPKFSDKTYSYMVLSKDSIDAINNALGKNIPVIINAAIDKKLDKSGVKTGYQGTISICDGNSKAKIHHQNFPILYQGTLKSASKTPNKPATVYTSDNKALISGKATQADASIVYQKTQGTTALASVVYALPKGTLAKPQNILITAPGTIPKASTLKEGFVIAPGQTLSYCTYFVSFGTKGDASYLKLSSKSLAAINANLANNIPVIINAAIAVKSDKTGYQGTISICDGNTQAIIHQQPFPTLTFGAWIAGAKTPDTIYTSTAAPIPGTATQTRATIIYQINKGTIDLPIVEQPLLSDPTGSVQNILIAGPLVSSSITAASASTEVFSLLPGQPLLFFAYAPYFGKTYQAVMPLSANGLDTLNSILKYDPAIITAAIQQNGSGYEGTITIYNGTNLTRNQLDLAMKYQQNFPTLYQGAIGSTQTNDASQVYLAGSTTAIPNTEVQSYAAIMYQKTGGTPQASQIPNSTNLVQNILINKPVAPKAVGPALVPAAQTVSLVNINTDLYNRLTTTNGFIVSLQENLNNGTSSRPIYLTESWSPLKTDITNKVNSGDHFYILVEMLVDDKANYYAIFTVYDDNKIKLSDYTVTWISGGGTKGYSVAIPSTAAPLTTGMLSISNDGIWKYGYPGTSGLMLLDCNAPKAEAAAAAAAAAAEAAAAAAKAKAAAIAKAKNLKKATHSVCTGVLNWNTLSQMPQPLKIQTELQPPYYFTSTVGTTAPVTVPDSNHFIAFGTLEVINQITDLSFILLQTDPKVTTFTTMYVADAVLNDYNNGNNTNDNSWWCNACVDKLNAAFSTLKSDEFVTLGFNPDKTVTVGVVSLSLLV